MFNSVSRSGAFRGGQQQSACRGGPTAACRVHTHILASPCAYWTGHALLLCRMMCFCPKHTPAGAAARQQQVWRTAAAASTGSNADQAAADRFSVGHGALSHQPGPAAAEQGCARETPYNHALRRGQREPDAIAAALAKRRFVQVLSECNPDIWSAMCDLKAVQVDHRLRRQCCNTRLACGGSMQSVEGSLGSWLVAQRMHAVKCPSLVLVAASYVHPSCSPQLVSSAVAGHALQCSGAWAGRGQAPATVVVPWECPRVAAQRCCQAQGRPNAPSAHPDRALSAGQLALHGLQLQL